MTSLITECWLTLLSGDFFSMNDLTQVSRSLLCYCVSVSSISTEESSLCSKLVYVSGNSSLRRSTLSKSSSCVIILDLIKELYFRDPDASAVCIKSCKANSLLLLPKSISERDFAICVSCRFLSIEKSWFYTAAFVLIKFSAVHRKAISFLASRTSILLDTK
jgi:hypothetical protein